MKIQTLDEDGNVIEEKEIEAVTPEEASDDAVASDYSSFADLYVDDEQQAEETEESGDDEDDE